MCSSRPRYRPASNKKAASWRPFQSTIAMLYFVVLVDVAVAVPLPLLVEPAMTAPITAAVPTPAATMVATEPLAVPAATVLLPAAVPLLSSAKMVGVLRTAVASKAALKIVFITPLHAPEPVSFLQKGLRPSVILCRVYLKRHPANSLDRPDHG